MYSRSIWFRLNLLGLMTLEICIDGTGGAATSLGIKAQGRASVLKRSIMSEPFLSRLVSILQRRVPTIGKQSWKPLLLIYTLLGASNIYTLLGAELLGG